MILPCERQRILREATLAVSCLHACIVFGGHNEQSVPTVVSLAMAQRVTTWHGTRHVDTRCLDPCIFLALLACLGPSHAVIQSVPSAHCHYDVPSLPSARRGCIRCRGCIRL
jgi:hypothetical protein